MNSKRMSLVLVMTFFSSIVNAQGMNQSFFDAVNELIGSGSYYETEISTVEKQQILGQVEQTFKLASGMMKGAEEDFKGWEPKDLKDEYYQIVYDLYTNGKCSLEQLEDFLKTYDQELVNKAIVVPAGVTDKRPLYLEKINEFFKKFLAKVDKNQPKCAVPGQIATAPKCCKGLYKMPVPDASRHNNVKGKRIGEACNEQSDCRSQVCLKDSLDEPGVCASIQQCYELQEIGGDCSGDRPFCKQGECLRIDKENVGGICLRIGASCTTAKADDCCSNSCVNNKCVENKVCMDCVRSGAKPAEGQTCCPGYYLDGDECKTMLRPLVPTVYSKPVLKKNILNSLIDFIIPSAHAACAGELTLGGLPGQDCDDTINRAVPAPSSTSRVSSGQLTLGGVTGNPGWSHPSPVYNPQTQSYESNGLVWVGQNPATEADYAFLDSWKPSDRHYVDPLSVVGKRDPNYSSFFNQASSGNFTKNPPLILERQNPFPNTTSTRRNVSARTTSAQTPCSDLVFGHGGPANPCNGAPEGTLVGTSGSSNNVSSPSNSIGEDGPSDAQIAACQAQFEAEDITAAQFEVCVNGTNSSSDTGVTGDSGVTGALDSVQQNNITNKKNACNSNFASDPDGLEACLSGVAAEEAALIEANIANATNADIKGANFARSVNAPQLDDKTYSDPKACVFHTFNDIWKDATPRERNAELFLRSFEYVFSNKASQDYWQDGDKGNIYRRARSVAIELRKNRSSIIERTLEIDKEITCKCIAIFGPLEFPQEKRDFFNENCAEEASQLRSELATDGQGDGGSNIDGSSQSLNDDLATEARMEEIDKGALALSHEKLLIEFLRLRAEAQMQRFTEATNLIEEMEALGDFISSVDFQEVWKDRVQGKNLVVSSPAGDSRLLYKWGYKYPALFLLILIAIIAFAVAFALPIIGGTLGALGVSLGATAIASIFIGSFGGAASPGVYDLKKVKGATYKKVLGVVIYKWDGFEKWYVGPKFDNKSAVNDTHCNITARASSCFKSSYAYKPEGSKVLYLGQIPNVGHYLLDTKLPYFVDSSHVVLDKMPRYFKTWPQIMNETVDEGVAYLKSTRPSSRFLKRDYYKAGKKFGKIDQFKKALDQKYFMPFRGNFQPEVFSKRGEIVNGAKKFALCRELKDQAKFPGCFLTDSEVEENALGFGHLFESPIEAEAWANYTYELHYVYPSITLDQYMGYPLMGAEHYFHTVAYMIKLVAAYSAQRSINYADAVDLYRQDWEKRAGDYSSLGEAVTFTDSRNIVFGEAFFDNFGLLNFSGRTNMEEFDSAFDKAKNSNKFTKAELDAFSSGRKFASKLNGSIDKQQAFDEKVGKTKEGQRRQNFKNKLSSALTNPIEVIQKSNPGLDSSSVFAGSENNQLAVTTTPKTNDTSRSTNRSKKAESSFLNDQSANLNQGTLNYGSGTTEAGGESYYQANEDDSLAGSKADDLINALSKDDSYTERGENDTLWVIVSKAYKRNYSRVLFKKADLEEKEEVKKEISDDQKNTIESLLD